MLIDDGEKIKKKKRIVNRKAIRNVCFLCKQIEKWVIHKLQYIQEEQNERNK